MVRYIGFNTDFYTVCSSNKCVSKSFIIHQLIRTYIHIYRYIYYYSIQSLITVFHLKSTKQWSSQYRQCGIYCYLTLPLKGFISHLVFILRIFVSVIWRSITVVMIDIFGNIKWSTAIVRTISHFKGQNKNNVSHLLISIINQTFVK